MPARPAQILTLMVEDYYQVGAFHKMIPETHWDRFESRLEGNLERVLGLLDRYAATATFFVSGWVAEHHPELVRTIAGRGHEVACQGYYHRPARVLAPREFEQDLERARAAVEAALGRAVAGFRIGRGWLAHDDVAALTAVRQAGFVYDSSVCPRGRRMPTQPRHRGVHTLDTRHGPLVEVPPSTLVGAGLALPVAGGNYCRQLPDRLHRALLERARRQGQAPLVTYFHLWEFDPGQPRIDAAGRVQRIRQYRNLADMTARLERLLRAYRFESIAACLDLVPEPAFVATRVGTGPDVPRTVSESASRSEQIAGTSERISLTLVIPCYEEEHALPYLARTLEAFERAHGHRFEFRYVWVDDGSRDGTFGVLERTFAGRPGHTVCRHPVNRGIAAALVTGFAAVDTELVAVLDADCTFDPNQLPAMVDRLTPDVDVVSASPAHAAGAMRNVPWWRRSLSRGSAFLYRQVLSNRLTSYTSCFRVYRRAVLEGITVDEPGFCGVTEILGRLDLAGARIVEFPAVLDVRLLGSSKMAVGRTTLDHLKLVARFARARLARRPLPPGLHGVGGATVGVPEEERV